MNNVNKLRQVSGASEDELSVDANEKTINYKGTLFELDEDGNVKKASGVALNKTSMGIYVVEEQGTSETLTATVRDGTENPTITWTSSNSSIATVTNGTVTAVAEGTAVIRATSESGEYKECTVTVTEIIPNISLTGKYIATSSYPVTYTDMYSTTSYQFGATTNDAWRILYTTQNLEDRTKVDLKIISTGIPARIIYKQDIEADWWGTDSSNRSAYRAANGLVNDLKFRQIAIEQATALGEYDGFFKEINGVNTSGAMNFSLAQKPASGFIPLVIDLANERMSGVTP